MLQIAHSIENSSHTPQSVTKHLQVGHIKIIKRFTFEGVYYQFLNIISTFLKSVTNQWRIKDLAFKAGLKAITCRECMKEACFVDIQSTTEYEIFYTFFTKRFICTICKSGVLK